MTKFRFDGGVARLACAVAFAAALYGCGSSGRPASSFVTPELQSAYMPLAGSAYAVLEGHAAAVSIMPGIAVTSAHNSNLIDKIAIIGISKEYDLMFFRVRGQVALPEREPYPGEKVVAYGQGGDDSLRMASGVVHSLKAPVEPNCATCHVQTAFTFEADAGPGFSGGPVVDAQTGALVGITFGYVDPGSGSRLMYAYDMDRVKSELAQVRTAAEEGRY